MSFVANTRDGEFILFSMKQSCAIEQEETVVGMANVEGSALEGEIVNGARTCFIK